MQQDQLRPRRAEGVAALRAPPVAAPQRLGPRVRLRVRDDALDASSLRTELGRAIHLRHHAAQQGDAERVHLVEIPYFNPTSTPTASTAAAAAFCAPGRAWSILAYTRGRVMNGERRRSRRPAGARATIRAEHGATAARCNLNKCWRRRSPRTLGDAPLRRDDAVDLLPVLVGDSPPSRGSTAIAAAASRFSCPTSSAVSRRTPWPFTLRWPPRRSSRAGP